MAFTPTLGQAGLYSLASPFNTKLVPDVAYRCVAIRAIEDLVGDGVDVFATYYEPESLTKELYLQDVEAKAYIVSLQSDAGLFVRVPTTYLSMLPNINGVPYLGTIVALDLSILPETIDLGYLRERLEAVVKDTIGVVTTSKLITTTGKLIKSQEDHAAIEATRAFNRTESLSDYAKWLKASTDLASALQQITELEAWIVANRPVVP